MNVVQQSGILAGTASDSAGPATESRRDRNTGGDGRQVDVCDLEHGTPMTTQLSAHRTFVTLACWPWPCVPSWPARSRSVCSSSETWRFATLCRSTDLRCLRIEELHVVHHRAEDVNRAQIDAYARVGAVSQRRLTGSLGKASIQDWKQLPTLYQGTFPAADSEEIESMSSSAVTTALA